jgi:hypothetical protein
MRRPVRTAAVALLASVALASCDVTMNTSATVRAADGDAAVALARDGALDALVNAYAQRAGVIPEVVRGDGTLGVTATVDYAALSSVSGLTGVQSMSVIPLKDGLVTVRAELVDPSELRAAVADAALLQDPSGAVADAMLDATAITLDVRMRSVTAARVTPHASPSTEAPTDATEPAQPNVGVVAPVVDVGQASVTVTQDLRAFVAATVEVDGGPGVPLPAWPLLAGAFVVAAVVGTAGVSAWARRRA